MTSSSKKDSPVLTSHLTSTDQALIGMEAIPVGAHNAFNNAKAMTLS